MSEPRIILAATPIGDVSDASGRLAHLLQTADIIAAEDTRRLLNLAGRMNITISAKVIAYHDHNERVKAPELLDAAEAGSLIVLVTDAGMPSVSDPGYRLVAAAHERGIPVTVAPGPSAVLTALALSGLATDRFSFEGFAPRKESERDSLFTELASEKRTMIFFDSPHRIAATLASMATCFGPDREACVCRELTKTYEEAKRGTLADLAEWAAPGLKGEITIVVSGATEETSEVSDHVETVLELVEYGMRMKDAAAYVAAKTGVRKKDLYETSLKAR